jgi:hypothetical protein
MMKFRFAESLLMIFLFVLPVRAAAPGYKAVWLFPVYTANVYDKLIEAIVRVESWGDTLAYNAAEEAVGAFQIRPIRLKDYNQRTGNNHKIEECYNYEFSKEIFLYYAKLTLYPDYEIIARNWNGSGKATFDYWKKVKSHL